MKQKLLLFLFILYSGGVYAQHTVTGQVTSSVDGSTLPGVTILVQGTSTGAISDTDGMYSINAPGPEAILQFSFISFESQTININGRTILNIVMEPSTTELDEVVVTALGISKERKALGYAVSTVKAEDLVKSGSPNFGSALYGKAAGVRIQAAPGGITSAVNINVRGMNSINFSSQPLIILDGVPIRNGENNNKGYWGDQRIRGNGLIDINPEDIADITILKGASASALYGSEAANGVVVITSKKGTKKTGLGVDVNYTYTMESPAFAPPYQNEYGPGYPLELNQTYYGTDEDYFLMLDLDGDGNATDRSTSWRPYGQFGAKFDGQPIVGWDGNVYPFEAQPDNWNNLFEKGFTSIANVAINQATETGSYRVSLTRTDAKPITPNSNHYKNNVNFNGNFKLGEKLTVDVRANYINQYTRNRPYKVDRITNNYGGFFSRFDKAEWYADNAITSKGYRFRTFDQPSATPDENLIYNMRASALLDWYWRTLKYENEEFSDRLISSVTGTWSILDGLTFRVRGSNDFTILTTENRSPNTVPLSIGNSGGYSMGSANNSIMYGDAILTYDKDITDDLSLGLTAGFNGRRVMEKNNSANTHGGLSTENWFHLNASVNPKRGNASYSELVKYAYFGMASLGFRDYAFVEFTGRQETSSTLPPGSNTFFYPSVNASFLFSDAFDLPSSIDYGKVRVGWGIVGNAPPIYAANNAYNQSSVNGIVYNMVPGDYGNEMIRPEEKHEFEVGVEMRMFESRLGLELNYYNNRIEDQILWLSVPKTVGASRMLTNIGELKNVGYEASLNFTPVRTLDVTWDVFTNFMINRNEVISLMEGVDQLTHRNIDAGAGLIVSEPGAPMGDILVYKPLLDDNGNMVVDDDDGLYVIDFTEQKKVGNVTPKIVGGIGSYIEVKGIFVDFTLDYRFGGEIISPAGHYMMGAGMFEETMEYRDAEHGGISYYRDADGNKIAFEGTTGPGGEKVWHDGIILPGVKSDGSPNDVIVDAASYYMDIYTWGANPAWGIPYSQYGRAVHKNDYMKFRSLAIGYNLPRDFAQRLKMSNLRVSLVANNLFYLYRTFKLFDAEAGLGSNWVNQAVVGGSTTAQRSIGFSIRASF